VLLAALREKAWFVLAGLLVLGGVLLGAALPAFELPTPLLAWAIGGPMIAAGLWVGLFLARVPHTQVWLDRDRRRVLLVSGRSGVPESKFADGRARSLDDFDHVRIYMRWSLASGADDHDQEVWLVTLEGRIPFTSEDGTVHLHGDAPPIGEFASDLSARKLAAEVGFHTGLKILDTGHDRTA
jgi:hypothetical protein